MGLKPRGFIAALLAAATLLTGGTTAFAADAAQGLSGDVGDTTGVTGGAGSQPSATPSTGTGGDAASPDDEHDADVRTGTDANGAADAGEDNRTSAPRAVPQSTPKTKAAPKATPDASKGRGGSLTVRAVVNTSLNGVTTTLYRIGDYPNGMTKEQAAKTSWDDLHVASTDATVRSLASKAASAGGVTVSSDPVDAIAHDLDPVSAPAALDALAAGLASSGVKPAATVDGERTVNVPEGVYLAVPNTPGPVASVGLTTLDGADQLADWGLGGADVQGRDTQPTVGDLPSPGQADADTGLLSRVMSLFGLTATRAAQPSFWYRSKNLDAYWVPGSNPKVYTGIFYLTPDQAGNGARTMALCTQAWANTPPDVNGKGTLYHQFAYGGPNSGFGRTTDQMRSVVYYSDSILRNMDQRQKLAWMHYAFSYIHNQFDKQYQTRGIPSVVLNHGQFKKLVDMAMNHSVGADTGIRMIFYRPVPVEAGQALVGWTRTPLWEPSIFTHAQYLPSRTAGWQSSAKRTIGLTNSLRDVVTIQVKRHYSDDWFVIESHLNVDTNGDKKPEKAKTVTRMVNDDWSGSRDFPSATLTPKDLGYTDGRWPANATIWWDTIVRASNKSEATDKKANSYQSFLKPVKGKGQRYEHIGLNPNREDPAEQYDTPDKPRIEVTTSARPAGLDRHANPASDTTPMRDAITVTHKQGNSIAKGAKVSMDVTLNMDSNGDGKADKTFKAPRKTETLASAMGLYQSRTFTSQDFRPSDLKGETKWRAGAKYWFDVTVFIQDGTWSTLALTIHGTHDGSGDGNEQFRLTTKPGTAEFSTKALSGTDAKPTAPPALSGGAQSVRDRLYAQCTDIPAGTKFTGTLTLNHSSNGDAKPEHTKAKAVTMTCGASWSPSYVPKDLGMTSWQAGKYWFNLSAPAQHYVEKPQHLDGFSDSAESWTVVAPKVTVATRAQNTFARAGGTGTVSDLIWTTCENVPDGTSFPAVSTLNVDTNGDGRPEHTVQVASTARCGVVTYSPAVGPVKATGSATWPDGKYWWNLTVPAKAPYLLKTAQLAGRTDAKESWSAAPQPVSVTLGAAKTWNRGSSDKPITDFQVTMHEGADGKGKLVDTRNFAANGNATFNKLTLSNTGRGLGMCLSCAGC
ncbi:Cell surface protein [Bifidobacterium margollesii]|uniref:Cell surface protein n=1 Tax=Bifidobacterium margollesii TaxID=2020964 RepID=A0A2N5J9I9_9BIFI|nr:hypothetical protein [Bifidobacterium margollesii]PLS30884.1 Cell surface protein [Bifidobacterium margollesii]